MLSGAPWLCPSRSISHVGTDFSIDSLGLSRRLGVPSRPSALLFASFSPFPLSSVILLAHPSPSPSPSLKATADGEVTINFQIEDDLERASGEMGARSRRGSDRHRGGLFKIHKENGVCNQSVRNSEGAISLWRYLLPTSYYHLPFRPVPASTTRDKSPLNSEDARTRTPPLPTENLRSHGDFAGSEFLAPDTHWSQVTVPSRVLFQHHLRISLTMNLSGTVILFILSNGGIHYSRRHP